MKNKNLIIKKNEKGQATLLIVLIVMGMLLFVGLALTNMTAKQTKITGDSLQSVQAYYLADTGAERLLYLTKTTGMINPSDYAEDDTLFTAVIPNLGKTEAVKISDSPLAIKVTGYYRNTARAVELSY